MANHNSWKCYLESRYDTKLEGLDFKKRWKWEIEKNATVKWRDWRKEKLSKPKWSLQEDPKEDCNNTDMRKEMRSSGMKKLQELEIEVKEKQEENDQTSNDKIFYIKML